MPDHRRNRHIPYDKMCYTVAEHFLRNIKDATDMDRTELAEEIQQLVEDFIISLHGDSDRIE